MAAIDGEQSSGRAACTTVNYGSPGDIDSAESSLQAAIDQINPLAAVTMEYDPSNTENPVSFWVFNMQSAEQERIEFLQLDNEHAKSVPGVCLNCHAGKFDSTTNSVTGATFLPFDVETFIFQAKGDFSESALSESIRELNDMVKRVNEGVGNTSIPTLIDGWYGDSSIEEISAPMFMTFPLMIVLFQVIHVQIKLARISSNENQK